MKAGPSFLPSALGARSLLALAVASLAIHVFGLAMPLALAQVYDRILRGAGTGTLAWLAAGVALAILFEALLRAARSRLLLWEAARFEHEAGVRVAGRFLAADAQRWAAVGTGAHLDRLNAVQAVKNLKAGGGVQSLLDLPFALLFLAAIFLLGGRLALWPLAVAVLYLGCMCWLKWRLRLAKDGRHRADERRMDFLLETMASLHSIKALASEERLVRRHEDLQARSAQALLEENRILGLAGLAGGFAAALAMFGVLALGGPLVAAGALSAGALTAAMMLSSRVLAPLQEAAGAWLRRAEAEGALHSLAEIEAMGAGADNPRPPLPADLEGRVSARGLRAEPGSAPLSFSVPAGGFAVLRGFAPRDSEALFSVLAGERPPAAGQACLDDFDVQRWDLSDAGGVVAFVPRHSTLFRGTLVDNLSLFTPSRRVEALDAAALLGLDEAVASLPLGYETAVDATSSFFIPGGVSQRVAVARALVRRPRVLLLDGTDAAMDEASAQALVAVLARLRGRLTVLCATERPALLALADAAITPAGPAPAPAPAAAAPPALDAHREKAWARWALQTARRWGDLAGLVRETGVESVDADHRHMADFALEMNQLLQGAEDALASDLQARLQDLLGRLHAYTAEHFAREEALMRAHGLGGLEAHGRQHAEILAVLRGVIADVASGRTAVSEHLRLTLLEWVSTHINESDYECLRAERWIPTLLAAESWEQVEFLVRPTGIAAVDAEHRELTAGMIALGRAPSAEALRDFLGRAQRHFAHEESLARRHGLPGLAAQEEAHGEFRRLMAGLVARAEKSPGPVREELLPWWLRHINGLDHECFLPGAWALVLRDARTWEDVAGLVSPTGLAEIDAEHRQLTELGLGLSALLETGAADPAAQAGAAAAILERMTAGARAHFAREEALLAGRPDLQVQREQHAGYLAMLGGLRADLAAERLVLSAELRQRLLEWWIHHVNVVDGRSFAGPAPGKGGA